MARRAESAITLALEELALALGNAEAVPLPQLINALDRAAERLRSRASASSAQVDLPQDLVTQSEAARAVGVSRQAVGQWVRKGTLTSYETASRENRYGPLVSLAEVVIMANRSPRASTFSAARKKDLSEFLGLLGNGVTAEIAAAVSTAIDESAQPWTAEHIKVLSEFVIATMGAGQQRELTPEGVRLLAALRPGIRVDPATPFGDAAGKLGLLITSTDGSTGFDSPTAALLGLIGSATIGQCYPGHAVAEIGASIASAAERVWGGDWLDALFDCSFHVSRLRPTPIARMTASLSYLDSNRFMRNAQISGVSVGYARRPGPIDPEGYYGLPVMDDILNDRRVDGPAWAFSEQAAACGFPSELASDVNPFRIMYFEHGLLDPSLLGITRYCYSSADAARQLRSYSASLPADKRNRYRDLAIATLTHALRQRRLELTAIDDAADFDWWKDHIIRSSPREMLLGLRDERARQTAHALLVETEFLPQVVDAADKDANLRDRLRIYVKNLEFDVIEERYRDDLRTGVSRLVKPAGQDMSAEEAFQLATEEIRVLLD